MPGIGAESFLRQGWFRIQSNEVRLLHRNTLQNATAIFVCLSKTSKRKRSVK